MLRNIVLVAVLCALPMAAMPQDGAGTDAKEPSGGSKATAPSGANGAKELSGMSVLGNNEAPKALYIVPWKSSEIGVASDLRSGLLNDAMVPVDKEVFMRELEFYEISTGK
jgi:hypothetical protein